MHYGEPQLLFYKYDIHAVMDAHRKKASETVIDFAENAILSTPADDLVESVLRQYRLEVPTLDRDNAHVDHQPGNVTVYDSYSSRGDNAIQIPGFIVELSVPFNGDKDFFFIRPTSYDSAPPRAIIDRNVQILRHTARELNGEQIRKGFDQTLEDIEKYLGWQRGSADPFNEQLANQIKTAVDQRKQKVLAAQSTVASLGYNLKPRTDAPKTYVSPVTRKPIPTRAPASTSASFKPEPALDEANYKHILSVIENMTHVMERSPTAFASMGEEDIRQHFLVQLNGQFEGQATDRPPLSGPFGMLV